MGLSWRKFRLYCASPVRGIETCLRSGTPSPSQAGPKTALHGRTVEGFFMHCFTCGEILDEVTPIWAVLARSGHICMHCDAMFITCKLVEDDMGNVRSAHVVEYIRGGVWGHTCPHHKPGPRLRGRSQAPSGSSYLITPCTTDSGAGGPSKT